MSGFVTGPEGIYPANGAPFEDGTLAQNFTVINSDILLQVGAKADLVEVIAEATGVRIQVIALDPREGDTVEEYRWDVEFADYPYLATAAAKEVADSITAGRIPPFFKRCKE
jgi:hypothetical protein